MRTSPLLALQEFRGSPQGGRTPDATGEGRDDLEWTVGHYAAFALPPSDTIPLLAGRILELGTGPEGREVPLEWLSPKRHKEGSRAEYGRASWSKYHDHNDVTGKLEIAQSWELTSAACITFPALLRADKLPQ